MISILFVAAMGAESSFADLDFRVTALEKKVAALESKLAACQCSAPAKAPTAVPEYTLTPSVKSNDAPTYHYPQNTSCQIVNGQVVCSQEPVAVSYPGGPMFQPIQQPIRRGWFGRRGGSCGPGGCN